MTGLNEALNEVAAIIKAGIGRMMNEEEKVLSRERKSVKEAGNTEFISISLFLLTKTVSDTNPTDVWTRNSNNNRLYNYICYI